MTQEEMEAILALGTNEEELAELMRQQARAEERGDATRGREYGTQAGRVYVANPFGAVSDMFVRGQADKKAEKIGGEIRDARRTRDQTTQDFVAGLMGVPTAGQGGPALDQGAFGPSKQPPQVTPPATPPTVQPMPQVTPPPAPAPRPQPGPPAPQAPPPSGSFAPSGGAGPRVPQQATPEQIAALLRGGPQMDERDQLVAGLPGGGF